MSEAALQAAIGATHSRYPDLLKREVSAALSQFRDLHPSTENYVFNDGRRAMVITLTGTIPVNYRGNIYNIPICLYLMDTHPYNPPMCYVRPTPDMQIKSSSNVDTSGRIYLPYLHQWKYPDSDLSGLLQIMTIVFSETCPVFAKSASTGNLASAAQGQYPGYPPYPTSGSGYMPMPQPPQPSGGGGSGGGGGGAYPPYPAPGGVRQPYYPATSGYSRAPYPPGTGYGYPSATTTSSTPSFPPYPIPSASSATGPSGVYTGSGGGQTQSTYSTGTIQPEHIRQSLVSAVQDKMRSRLREAIGTAHAELQSIKKIREDLNGGEQKIKTMLNKIQNEQSDLDSSIVAYQERCEEINKVLAMASESEELSIDDCIDTTAPLYRQLLNCYVEDNAIEDCIYYLSQALKRNKLDLETFLKCVRTLSRQQFQLRAVMLRCRRVAMLDP